MKRIAGIAVAVTVLAAIGLLAAWLAIGGSSNIAFAAVAAALENLRSATYDMTVEMKNPTDGEENCRITMKCTFLAPARERIEMPAAYTKFMGSDMKISAGYILILDSQARKGLLVWPETRTANVIDGTSKTGAVKIRKKPAGGPPDLLGGSQSEMFDFVRRLVREGSDGGREKFKSIGEKGIDGRTVVGFRKGSDVEGTTLWADPQTARLVRVEIDKTDNRVVMNHFRYDVELDPSLLSLEPPAGYNTPGADDLVDVLRFLAEHNDGSFPPEILGDKCGQAVSAVQAREAEKLLKTPEVQKLMEKLQAQYGKDQAGLMKAYMKESMKVLEPYQKMTQKYVRGEMFCTTLKPENDSHYAGNDVKLGTPDRPIFWYKPTGSEKYNVVYADLRVKVLAPEEAKKLPQTKPK